MPDVLAEAAAAAQAAGVSVDFDPVLRAFGKEGAAGAMRLLFEVFLMLSWYRLP